jgi:glyoxylase-like metal-dependent hydrolase (beta-lactamase superfamily II)
MREFDGRENANRRGYRLSRRSVVKGVAMLPLATAGLVGPAAYAAAAPPTGEQAPGFYRFRVGSYELTNIYDGELARPLDASLIPNASPDDILPVIAAAGLPTDHIDNPYVFTAINTGSQLILVDVGTRGKFAPPIAFGARNMTAAGINPADVDLIILTHFHPDHLLGLTDRDNNPLYPKADVAVGASELKFWDDDNAMARADDRLRPFFGFARRSIAPYRDRLRPFGDGDVVAPGIQAIATPGHTPGHMVIQVADGEDQLLVLGDAISLPYIFVRHPEWHQIFDMDQNLAEQQRWKILRRAADENLRVVGAHFPFPAIGRIIPDGDSFIYAPEQWSSAVH